MGKRKKDAFYNSYSSVELAHMFELNAKLTRTIMKRLQGKIGYEEIFEDEKRTLYAPKDLIDGVSSKKRPLRELSRAERKVKGTPQLKELFLTEQKRREGKLVGAVDLSRRFGIDENAATLRVRWLPKNGYEEQIAVSYLGHLYTPLNLIENDNFVASIFSEETRKKYYYTSLELCEKFPHMHRSSIYFILRKYKENKKFKDRIRDGFPNTSYIERGLIDQESVLRTELKNFNRVMDPESNFISSPELRQYTIMSDRGFRNRLQTLRNQYPKEIILARNMYYVDLVKLHNDPDFKAALLIPKSAELPKPAYLVVRIEEQPKVKIEAIPTKPSATVTKPKQRKYAPKKRKDRDAEDSLYLSSLADAACTLSNAINQCTVPEVDEGIENLLSYIDVAKQAQALSLPDLRFRYWPALEAKGNVNMRLESIIEDTIKYLKGDVRYAQDTRVRGFWSYLADKLVEIKEEQNKK